MLFPFMLVESLSRIVQSNPIRIQSILNFIYYQTVVERNRLAEVIVLALVRRLTSWPYSVEIECRAIEIPHVLASTVVEFAH